MINIDKLLGQILGAGQGMASGQSPLGQGSLGGALGSERGKALMGGLVLGGLAGALTGKTGQKIASTALKLGGAAAVAGLAYTAYQRYQAQQRGARLPSQPQPQSVGYSAQAPATTTSTTMSQRVEEVVEILPPVNSGYLPPLTEAAATDALSLKLIRAMIAAAKADGRIDAAESAKIFGQMDAMNFNDEERNFLMAELGKTWTVDQVAAGAATVETAVELYAASVIAVDPTRPAEREYLGRLAQRLNLEPGLVNEIHARCST
ncbi:MAG: tellurite resistance TerB family protein [Rhodospirillaceae bacterium]|nr:tellurite resistance TerB family protein [Rhodospirillaceae bacterium]